MRAHEMVGHLIRRLHQIETQIFVTRAREAGFEITPVQFAAMDALNDHPGIDQATVAALIDYDRTTIGGVINRLVSKGLVERTVNMQDRRARAVRLTADGAQTYIAILPLVQAVQDEILSGLDTDERATFNDLVRKAVSVQVAAN